MARIISAPRFILPAANAAVLFTADSARPVASAASGDVGAARLSPRGLIHLLREYYRNSIAWLALLVFSVILAYGGGAVLFWFHAIYLGEGGPAISPWLHWLLDSSAGFVGLTPALFVIMPLAASVTATAPALRRRYTLLTGTVFAFVTAPGPLLHNALVGRGTWIAEHVTALVGNGRPAGAPHHIPPLADMAGQVAVGLPTYVAFAGVALFLVRLMTRRRRALDTPRPSTG